MKVGFARISVRSLSIRMLVVLWAGSVFLAWGGLVGGWFAAKSRLSRIDQRIALDAEALGAAHDLEQNVLAERYEDLLWKATGRFSVNKTEVDLCVLVHRLIQSQAQAFADHRIIIQGDQVCTVLGDPDRLERVVQNLVSNAVKYSPRDTPVTIRIERQEPFARLAVTDQGRGISAEDQKVLFQPLGRGRSAELLAEGTGMGLYVVKQIIEAHGGQITVESEPGQGTTFRIQLPLACAHET